jgi:hypothetical protein
MQLDLAVDRVDSSDNILLLVRIGFPNPSANSKSPGFGRMMCAIRKPTLVGVKNSPALCPEPSGKFPQQVL